MDFFTFNSLRVGIIFQQTFICILCIWYLVFHTKDSFSKLFPGLALIYDTPISKQEIAETLSMIFSETTHMEFR